MTDEVSVPLSGHDLFHAEYTGSGIGHHWSEAAVLWPGSAKQGWTAMDGGTRETVDMDFHCRPVPDGSIK